MIFLFIFEFWDLFVLKIDIIKNYLIEKKLVFVCFFKK